MLSVQVLTMLNRNVPVRELAELLWLSSARADKVRSVARQAVRASTVQVDVRMMSPPWCTDVRDKRIDETRDAQVSMKNSAWFRRSPSWYGDGGRPPSPGLVRSVRGEDRRDRGGPSLSTS